MVFSSLNFLFVFLPIFLILYFLVPRWCKNAILFIASLIFYAWGEPVYVVLMIFSTLVDYTHGMLVEKYRGTRTAKAALISSVVINLALLGVFKYTDFILASINSLLGTAIPLPGLPLPIGISFYTFQTMSYTIDVYRGEARAQRNIISFGAYVALFPQLIAGPIVRYQTVAEQLNSREHTVDRFADGAQRFVAGMAKKVLLANNIGAVWTQLSALSGTEQSVLGTWLGIIAYSFQIYFDFSGYSDMAIGLGRIFGFHFVKNFNYPFISKSVTEFWRRWHMSLGTWFRDYVYIPLGGNRVVPWRRIFNILVVWGLTGFWHGANWNFILWGLFYAALLIAEKQISLTRLEKLPAVLRHAGVCLVTMLGFVLFANEDLGIVLKDLSGLFGGQNLPLSSVETFYYLRSFLVVIVVSMIASTPLFSMAVKKLRTVGPMDKVLNVLQPVAVIALLVLCTAYLVDGSFNPFLYFRF